jgi:Spy/CpxP family protein refolding chaperone
MKRKLLIFSFASLLLLTTQVVGVRAQDPDHPQGPPPGRQMDDPIQELRLTPEQREKIRSIREEMRDERAVVNQRQREARRALDEALDADQPDEALVEQRVRELAAAQTAQMRINTLTEVRIRKVLTTEQRALLREIRQAMQFRRQRQMDNQPRRDRPEGPRRAPGGRNALGPPDRP